MSVALKEEILNSFHTPGHPIAYSAPSAVARFFNISEKKVRDILEHSDTYVLHREYKRPRVFNPYFIYNRRELVQADLIDIQSIHTTNDNVKYLLVIIDVFSRKIWVYPLKRKNSGSMMEALRAWQQDIDRLPEVFSTDHGTEFFNRPVQNFFASNNVDQQLAVGTSKAAIAERVNKTLQILIYKYLTDKETLRYIDVLPQLVETYNNRKHRALAYQFSPNEADLPRNEPEVLGIHRARIQKVKRKKPKFKVGDIVRVKTDSRVIDTAKRAYAEQFRGEYFTIFRVNTRLPIPLYYLRSNNTNEEIRGGFYAEELQRVQGNVYKIEAVLRRRVRRRRREALVKWKYFGPEHNSWIPERDLVGF